MWCTLFKSIFTYCAEGLLHIALLQQEGVVVANDQPIEVRRGCHLTSGIEVKNILVIAQEKAIFKVFQRYFSFG